MPQQSWIIGSEQHVGLVERGNPVLDQTPIAAVNGAAATNAVLSMRQGMLADDLTGTGFTGPVLWLGRFITNQGVEEIWAAADNGGTAALARKVNNVWSTVAFSDTPNAANLIYMQGVGMNGKFFLAYDSNVNRLHVWDGVSVRRVGLSAPPGAPALASAGAGSLSFTRWYRIRATVMVATVVARRSEPSPAASITISASVGVTVQRGTLDASATHWDVEAADAATGPWYRIDTQPVSSNFSNDGNVTIPTANPSTELGSYDPPPSAKYLSTDGFSLMMGGAWETVALPGETVPKQNRVWFTPPLGSSDIGDDERISNTLAVHGWLDVGDAGPITALAGPVYGETFVFKKASAGKLTPTGNVDAPYALSMIAAVGCVDQRLLTMGEVGGTPAVVFADTNAVYAMTAAGGTACISEPIGLALRGLTIVAEPGLLIYDPLERTLLLQTSHAPSTKLGTYKSFMFDCYKKRWEGFALGGASGGWILGVSQLGIDNVLGGGGTQIENGCYADQNGERRLYVCGSLPSGQPTISSRGGQAVLDVNQSFTTQVRYRKVFKPGFNATVGCPTVYFSNPMGTAVEGTLTLTASYVKDFTETRTQSVALRPTEYQSRIDVGVFTFEGISSADVSVLDLVLSMRYEGTPYESPVTPTIHCVVVPYTSNEARAQ